jgi:hypothetical protein
MSTDAGAGVGETDATERTTDWESMLETLDVAIDEASYKIENGRIRSPENEKVRIKWVRALAYAMNVRRQIANDRDLEELAERLDELEATQNR